MDIDVDIEKKIAQLQEGRINGSIKPISSISIDPDKQIKEWNLEKGFESFLTNIEIKKEDLGKKIAEEEKKINALEGLFTELTNTKKPKKKKELLAEPEKLKLKVEPNDKPIDPQPPVDISPIKEEKIVLDPEAQRLVLERYGQLNQGFPLPKEVESDPDIVNKVMSHIKEMKVANELEKEKMTGLKSIDTLEKLTREFLNFKHVTNMQMGTIGGGGGVQLLDMDDVNISTKSNGFILQYNASTERMDFVDPAALNSTLIISDGGTIGSTTTTDAITIAADGDITLKGDLTVEGTTTSIDSTTIQIQNSFKFEGATADAHETNLTTIDPTADRTISLPNVSGTLPVLAAVSATQITSTPEELNILDGATVVVGEINALDLGSTAVGTAIASKAVILDSNKDYTGLRNFTVTGELDAATLDISGDADIDGTLETDALSIDGTAVTSTAAELNLVDGITAGTISASLAVIVDSNKDITGFRNVTLTGELDAATGDFSGDVDIDGTLEADAITVNGTTLAEFISDTTGAMFSSNTETGITATYQDGDNTIDLAIAAAQTTITSLLATDIKIGEDDQTKIDFETADTINFYAGNEKQLILTDGALTPGADNILDLGSSGVEFKDGYFDGTVTADAFAGPLTGNVTGNASGSAATVTTAAQSAITSLGTLTTLTVDNVITNGTTIGHTDDTDLMTLADGILTVAGEVQMTTLDIGGTNVTSTAAELNLSDLATLGTSAASKVLSTDANNLTTISGAVLNTEDALSDGANIAWNVINSPVAKVTLAGNRNLSAPSGSTPAAGQFVSLLVIQDGTGSRTLTFNAVYEFTGDAAPTLTTTANKGDLFVFRYNGAKWLEVGRNLNLTLS